MIEPAETGDAPETKHDEIVTEGSKTKVCDEALETVDAYIAMHPAEATSTLNKVHNALAFLRPFCVMADTDVSVTVAPPAPPPAALLEKIGTAAADVIEQLRALNAELRDTVMSNEELNHRFGEITLATANIAQLTAPDLVRQDAGTTLTGEPLPDAT